MQKVRNNCGLVPTTFAILFHYGIFSFLLTQFSRLVSLNPYGQTSDRNFFNWGLDIKYFFTNGICHWIWVQVGWTSLIQYSMHDNVSIFTLPRFSYLHFHCMINFTSSKNWGLAEHFIRVISVVLILKIKVDWRRVSKVKYSWTISSVLG